MKTDAGSASGGRAQRNRALIEASSRWTKKAPEAQSAGTISPSARISLSNSAASLTESDPGRGRNPLHGDRAVGCADDPHPGSRPKQDCPTESLRGRRT